MVIALSGGELLYFELDAMGQLAQTDKKEMGGDVAALDVGPVPPGRQRSRFLAVGSFDSTIRVLSLDPADTMKVLALKAPCSVQAFACGWSPPSACSAWTRPTP